MLRRALGPDAVRLGAECAALDQDEDAVTVRLVGGGVERGAVVIGADGLHSRVRTALVHDGPPRYAGITAWRGVVPLDDTLARRVCSGESFGRGALFGVARLSGSQVYWWAGVRRRESGGDEPRAEKSALLRAFADWHDPIPELVAATPPEAITRTCLYDRPALARLSLGRIALAGDAAHPMLPNLGQGACQAIEDAVVLGEELAASDVVVALERYGARRAVHAADVVRASRADVADRAPAQPRRGGAAQRAVAGEPSVRIAAPARAHRGPRARRLLADLRAGERRAEGRDLRNGEGRVGYARGREAGGGRGTAATAVQRVTRLTGLHTTCAWPRPRAGGCRPARSERSSRSEPTIPRAGP